jgi:hypothetical protein
VLKNLDLKEYFYPIYPYLFSQGSAFMGKGFGYGKVILFGEHFVVHGVPGIVSAIDSTNDAKVEKTGSEIVVNDERKTAKGYS